MVWVIGHYPDCNSGRPCLVVDDYKKKHNLRKSAALPPMCFLKIEENYDKRKMYTRIFKMHIGGEAAGFRPKAGSCAFSTTKHGGPELQSG